MKATVITILIENKETDVSVSVPNYFEGKDFITETEESLRPTIGRNWKLLWELYESKVAK